jgi:salicylate hydroxylase
LYDEAIRQGAEICLGTAAIAIDVEQGTITTKTGDILEVDVIVGADGIAGLTRTILL